MANKVIISILVLLLILMGGIGYYSYTLNQRIDRLGGQLSAFEAAQSARIDTVNDELEAFRTETLTNLSALEGRIEETQAEIDSLKEEAMATQNQISSLKEEIGQASSQIENLEDKLTSTVAELSRSVIDASEVYQKINRATVLITDGQIIGSGFIFDAKAHVLTNNHVVENASPIFVILSDGRILKATTVGSCPFSDVAVLRLEENPDIEPLVLADSSKVVIGEPVLAVGNPFGLKDSLTVGIISQVNRYTEIQSDDQSRWVANLLQFDAAVNPGNSGGPLSNVNGEVIGMVVARVNADIGDGIYWAISANKVKRVAAALIDHGYFDYPWIGVVPADLTPQTAQDRALQTVNGVLVEEVVSDSPAKKAGMKANDIIISVDGIPVKDSADLNSYLGEFKSPGDVVIIGLIRRSVEIELSLKLGKRPS